MSVHYAGDYNLFGSHLEILVFLGRPESSLNEEN